MVKNKKKNQKDIEKEREAVFRELENIPNSKTAEEAEKLHKHLSFMSTEDFLKPFTI